LGDPTPRFFDHLGQGCDFIERGIWCVVEGGIWRVVEGGVRPIVWDRVETEVGPDSRQVDMSGRRRIGVRPGGHLSAVESGPITGVEDEDGRCGVVGLGRADWALVARRGQGRQRG
jgi:hypothetical protein